MSAIKTADLPYHTLEENTRLPTADPNHYPLRLNNQIVFHIRQVVRYHNLPVNKLSNSFQYFTITCIQELNRVT